MYHYWILSKTWFATTTKYPFPMIKMFNRRKDDVDDDNKIK